MDLALDRAAIRSGQLSGFAALPECPGHAPASGAGRGSDRGGDGISAAPMPQPVETAEAIDGTVAAQAPPRRASRSSGEPAGQPRPGQGG